MNPWLIEIVKDADEQLFSERDVERMIAFADTLPARIKLGEDLERWEADLAAAVAKELAEAHPDRPGYTPAAVRDVVASLRHLFVSVFRDEPEFLAYRWTDCLVESLRQCGLDRDWAAAIYRAIDERLRKQLRGASLELYGPAMDGLLDTLQTPAA